MIGLSKEAQDRNRSAEEIAHLDSANKYHPELDTGRSVPASLAKHEAEAHNL